MHPAYSVIFFTTASGAGLGLLVWLGLGNALDLLPKNQWFGFFGVGIAVVLLSADLMSSTFHLGRLKAGGDAIALVEVDGAVPADLLGAIQKLPHVKQAKALKF